MEIFVARAWFIFDSNVFRKPCAFLRGKDFISQPFFSKTVGRVITAFVVDKFALEHDEASFLSSTLEASDLPDRIDRYDNVVVQLTTNTEVLERLAKSAVDEARRKLADGTIAEMYKPLGAYFDAFDCLNGSNPSEPPPPRTKAGQPIH